MKGRILVTGFEPFGGDDVNPSGDVLSTLEGTEISGYKVVTALLPVEWGTVRDRMEALIRELEPAVILSLGLAAGRSEISVEKVAINYTSESKDNKGVIPAEREIIPGAPDGYFATLPAEEVVEAVRAEGIPAKLSLSAGAYLCNYAFFCASHLTKQGGGKTQVGFIHIPATPEMVAKRKTGVPSMELSRIKRAVEISLRTAVNSFQNVGDKEGF
ncbi:MAG TPA: pyroglutamyl-peptidase I [Firmicutes bacterium]|nr:pyroglutamyl-peptidase I [Candidatus Fermentithermobacillaceae bacterium]